MAESTKNGKKRLSLELSADAYAVLSELSAHANKNMSDVLRTGLALYEIALAAKDNRQSLCVAEDGKVVKEILLT